MAVSQEFADYLLELFAPLGRITLRRMFSGAGVYADGIIFALVIEDTVYLKTDEENRPQFEAAGLNAFSYKSGERMVSTSYFRAPDDALESPALMRPWARSALAASLRAPTSKRSRK